MAEWLGLCRGCLSSGPQVSFFDGDDEIRTKFFESTSIEVTENDNLPPNLCLDCLDVLNTAHEFRKQCLRNDAELRFKLEMIESIHVGQAKKNNTRKHFDNINEFSFLEELNVSNRGIKVENSALDYEIGDGCYVLVISDDGDDRNSDGDTQLNFLRSSIKLESLKAEVEAEEILTQKAIAEAENLEDFVGSEEDDQNDLEQQLHELHHNESNFVLHEVGSQEETTMIEPDISAFVHSETDGEMDDGDSNEAAKKIMAIMNSGVEDMMINDDGTSVTYITAQHPDSEDGMQEEIVVCEGDEQYGIINYDGSDLVIGYAEDELRTVIQQEDGTYLCDCGVHLQDLMEYEKHQWVHGLYPCPICGKYYESNEILTGHMLLHSNNDASISCPYCHQYIKRNYLTQHIKVTHNEIRPQCTTCFKTFANENNLKRHMLIHKGVKDFACDVCNKRFNQKITMQTHRLTHETVDVQMCNICRRFFDSQDALDDHLACHESEDNKAAENISDGIEFGTGNVLVKFSCPECSKVYGNAVALNCHMENSHSICEKGELLCSECGEVLPDKKAMFAHSFTHRSSKMKSSRRFICGTCTKQCASHAMLIMHERVHTNERPFHCDHCPLRFKTKTHLRTHQLTHTREKKFGCSVCMKFFALKGNLVVHLRTHTGERPYVCSLCSEAFIDSKYLKKHKMKRHSIINLPWNRYN